MIRKWSLRDHPMIKCTKNTQQINRGTPQAEAWFQQSSCYASLLKLLFGMGAPAPCRFSTYAQNPPKTKHLQMVGSDVFTTHSSLILQTT